MGWIWALQQDRSYGIAGGITLDLSVEGWVKTAEAGIRCNGFLELKKCFVCITGPVQRLVAGLCCGP
jgi:hypothetical protein